MSTSDDYYLPGIRRKLLVVAGTRPEAIKLLPLVQAMRQSRRYQPFLVATGQHPGVVERVFGHAGLTVDADLGVGRAGLTLNELFSAVLCGLERFCTETFGLADRVVTSRDYDVYPAACAVHGDTSSAAAAALSCFHLQIPVVHVEAGLRTSNTSSPFSEELNRQIISRIASFHLAPTFRNRQNLVREGIPGERIFVSGNTAIDALRRAAEKRVPYGAPELEDLEEDEETPVVVVTAHRRENWGTGLQRIAAAVDTLAERYPDVRFVLPLHPNPAVGETLRPILEGRDNVALVAPMEYLAFARLLHRATLAISDSGGVQEEAPAVGTPVLVTRETTERQEGVDAGTLLLVGTDHDRIVAEASRLLDDPDALAEMVARPNPYGDGHAAERIARAFEHIAFGGPEPVPYGSGFNRLEVLRAAGWERDPAEITLPAPGRGRAVLESGPALDGVHLL